MAESLAVKYRPKEFDEVCSQKAVIQILEKQLSQKEVKNCYLFCGPSGTGKTTLARIYANKLNGGIGQPIEIDAASNSGVENVRQIIKAAQERSLQGKYKVYIIDECHALSNAAWQAFLKCIEEPPRYTIFMFCTTDPQKIPQTILNRVCRFNITKIPTEELKNRLLYVCKQENFTNYEAACDYISKISNGGARDSLANLEKAAAYSTDLSLNNVLTALGNYSYNTFFELLNAFIDADQGTILRVISNYYEAGNDLKLFVDQFLAFTIDVTKYSIFKSFELIKIPENMKAELDNVINIQDATKYFTYVIDRVLDTKNMIKNDSQIRASIEVMFLRIARGQ
jgi:DNA polymerase-3 subunit gamma/tau|uniref:DNA-directed DNA polymerase n=1 Tax=Siphoviridae sp. ctrgt10 TaxID=2826479 RepID=A0A8S5M769_9CAUD|nr:MAG TPA: activator clamp loader [Siphoviridae sp. ctrgt10]